MWSQSRYWRRRQLHPWPDLTESFDDSKLPIDEPVAASLDATVTAGQGSQSAVAAITLTLDASVTAGQGSQSVAAVAALTLDGVATLNQKSQSVAAVAALTLDGIATIGQGSQSVAAVADFALPPFDGVVTAGQGSQSVTALADTGVTPTVVTPVAGGGSGGERVSFADADRIRRQVRNIEKKRATSFKDPKRLERQLTQIYETLYETPYRDELPAANEINELNEISEGGIKPFMAPPALLKDLGSIRRLLDLYQLHLDDEEAISLLLLL